MECDLRTLDPRVGLTPECFRLFHSFQWKRRGTGTGGPQLGHVPGNTGIVTVTAMPGRAETQWTDTAGGFLSQKSSCACLRRHLASWPPQPVSHVCSGFGKKISLQ